MSFRTVPESSAKGSVIGAVYRKSWLEPSTLESSHGRGVPELGKPRPPDIYDRGRWDGEKMWLSHPFRGRVWL
jgi:hypothetical protein